MGCDSCSIPPTSLFPVTGEEALLQELKEQSAHTSCKHCGGRVPGCLQTVPCITEDHRIISKERLEIQASETTHSLPKALPLLPIPKHEVSFPNAKYNYKQVKPNKAQVSPLLLWGEEKE